MKKGKKLVAMILAITLIATAGFTMAACEKDNGSNGNSENATTDTSGDTGITMPSEFKGKDILKDDIEIWYIPLSTAGIENKMVNLAIEYVVKYYPNIKVVVQDAQFNPETQVNFLNEALTQGVDCVMIEAMDPGSTQGPIEALEAAGIPVITVNLDSFAVNTLFIIGNGYDSGKAMADTFAAATDGKGIAATIDGPAAQAENNLMCPGFQDQLKEKYPGIKFTENAYTENWDAAVAQTNMATLIQKYPDLTMVYCATDDLANGATVAIKAAGKEDQILVGGSIGFPDALKRIKEGTQFATYFSDYYVEYSTALYQALYCIQAGISVKTLHNTETPHIEQPTTPVTKENVDLIIETSHWKEADPTAWN